MQNVVVLYHVTASASYLDPSGQSINSTPGLLDSRALFGDGSIHPKTKKAGKEALQSTDGIQFYHFRGAGPAVNPATSELDPVEPTAPLKGWNAITSRFLPNKSAVAPQTIDDWMKIAQSKLPVGEKIDAVVIPCGTGVENSIKLEWVKTLKQKFPGIKILASNPNMSPSSEQNEQRFVIPLSESTVASSRGKGGIIRKDSPAYKMAEGLDMVTYKLSPREEANALRALLEMQQLPTEQGLGRS